MASALDAQAFSVMKLRDAGNSSERERDLTEEVMMFSQYGLVPAPPRAPTPKSSRSRLVSSLPAGRGRLSKSATMAETPRMGRVEKRKAILRLMQQPEVYEQERPLPWDIRGRYTQMNIARYVAKGGLRAGSQVKMQQKFKAEASRRGAPKPNQLPPVMIGAIVTPPEPEEIPCVLFKLPAEVRGIIYRYLLVVPERIKVRNGWTEPYGRTPPVLPGKWVLLLNREIYNEAVRVLYMENTFEYFLRDTTESPESTSVEESNNGSGSEQGDHGDDTFMEAVPKRRPKNAKKQNGGTIDIKSFGHMMRHLVLRIESNRTGPEYRQTMANAISVFLDLKPRRANIHTMEIEISPTWVEDGIVSYIDFFVEQSSITQALKLLPCQFIKIVIRTPRSRKVEVVINRKYSASIRRERRGLADYMIENETMRQHRHDEAAREWQKLMTIAQTIRDECVHDMELLKCTPEDDDSDDVDAANANSS